jgi:predicted metal-dependent phosphoesterase TrpH
MTEQEILPQFFRRLSFSHLSLPFLHFERLEVLAQSPFLGHSRAMPFYRVELHSHCQGDPIDTYLGHTLFQHIDRAKEIGLNAIAVTWHQKICAVPEAFSYAKERNILLIPGMEADVDRRHLVILNLAEGDLPGEPTWNQIRALRARKPETFVLAPHPFYPHPCCLGKVMNEHVDSIDAVEWCMMHVHWLPGRVNPNLRAARWAQQHGKPIIACSDAHSLAAIGKNASTVEADELTIKSLFAGIRAGRVSFHRHSLELGPLIYQTSKAMASQPRHIGRWVKSKIRNRRPRASLPAQSRIQVLP